MQTTKLETVEQVNEAMRPLLLIGAADLRALKPAQRRQRAARLADLYELRAQLLGELDLATAVVPAALGVAHQAFEIARRADRNSARFWRREAGAR